MSSNQKRLLICTSISSLRPCSHLPSTVPERDYGRALMWTHCFFKDSPQNSGTVSVLEYKVEETLYSGTKVGFISWVPSVWTQHHFVPVSRHQCSGTKCEHGLRAGTGSQGTNKHGIWDSNGCSKDGVVSRWHRELQIANTPTEKVQIYLYKIYIAATLIDSICKVYRLHVQRSSEPKTGRKHLSPTCTELCSLLWMFQGKYYPGTMQWFSVRLGHL